MVAYMPETYHNITKLAWNKHLSMNTSLCNYKVCEVGENKLYKYSLEYTEILEAFFTSHQVAMTSAEQLRK